MEHETDTRDDDGATEVVAVEVAPAADPPSEEDAPVKRNLNSYYGHKVGFCQSLSLLLNAGLMIYAHVGLSAVIFSSRDPSITSDTSNNLNSLSDNNTAIASNDTGLLGGICNKQDIEIWTENGGETNRPKHSNFCSRTYNGGCFVNSGCIETCFQETFGYSADCSTCFGTIPSCSMNNGCTWICAADSFSEACQQCNSPCVAELQLCTGLPEVEGTNETLLPIENNETFSNVTLPPSNIIDNSNTCNEYDLEAIDEWYNAYNLTFVKSVNDAWNGDAQLLAVIVVLFSGIWPYAKNIILIIVWYLPMTEKAQTSTIVWLSRLSKYTLVDVFAVIGVLVGVQLQLNIGGTETVIRAEPRFGIIAFFLATVWEFLQIEVIKDMHERKIVANNSQEGGERLYFSKLWIPVIILLVSIGLYIAGAITEIARFTSFDSGTGMGCEKSYNLVTLANALINDISMASNSAAGQTWMLYLIYILLNVVFPVVTHILQIFFIIGWFQSKKLKTMIKWTVGIWCFSCIEVLLIGIFAVEFKFPQLVMKIAGDTNAGFLDISSSLGEGFYILIAYSVAACFLQLSLNLQHDNPAKPSMSMGGEDKKKQMNDDV